MDKIDFGTTYVNPTLSKINNFCEPDVKLDQQQQQQQRDVFVSCPVIFAATVLPCCQRRATPDTHSSGSAGCTLYCCTVV